MSHADKVIEAIKAMTPEERVQSLISAGIIREDGTLMPQYGGTSTSGDIPTPETDAVAFDESIDENGHIFREQSPDGAFVDTEHARDLERRLAAATARAEELTTACKEACGKLAEHVAHDMDHRQKDHSRWYKAVQRVRELLDFQP